MSMTVEFLYRYFPNVLLIIPSWVVRVHLTVQESLDETI